MTVFTAKLGWEIQVGYHRIRSLSKDFSLFSHYIFFITVLTFRLLGQQFLFF